MEIKSVYDITLCSMWEEGINLSQGAVVKGEAEISEVNWAAVRACRQQPQHPSKAGACGLTEPSGAPNLAP